MPANREKIVYLAIKKNALYIRTRTRTPHSITITQRWWKNMFMKLIFLFVLLRPGMAKLHYSCNHMHSMLLSMFTRFSFLFLNPNVIGQVNLFCIDELCAISKRVYVSNSLFIIDYMCTFIIIKPRCSLRWWQFKNDHRCRTINVLFINGEKFSMNSIAFLFFFLRVLT